MTAVQAGAETERDRELEDAEAGRGWRCVARATALRTDDIRGLVVRCGEVALLAALHPPAIGQRVVGRGFPPAVAVEVRSGEADGLVDALVFRPLRAGRELGDSEIEVTVDVADGIPTELMEQQPAPRRHPVHREDCALGYTLSETVAGQLRFADLRRTIREQELARVLQRRRG